jgi:hypothetical protein
MTFSINPFSRIKELEKENEELENKTQELISIINELHDYIDKLENNQTTPKIEKHKPKIETITNDKNNITVLELKMNTDSNENEFLKKGFYQSEGSFRWCGKDNENPIIKSNIIHTKDTKIELDIFIPKKLDQKLIKIKINNKIYASFQSNSNKLIKKIIYIEKNTFNTNEIEIKIISDFWTDKQNKQKTIAISYLKIEAI